MFEISNALTNPSEAKKTLEAWTRRGLKVYNPKSKKFDLDVYVSSLPYPLIIATNGQRMMPHPIKGLTNDLIWKSVETFWGAVALDGIERKPIVPEAPKEVKETTQVLTLKIIFPHPIDKVFAV